MCIRDRSSLDNLQLIVPNGQIWGSTITNYSIYDKRRLDLRFGVAYETDISFVETLIYKVLTVDSRVHDDPKPLVKVDSIEGNAEGIMVRVWCNASDFFMLKLDLITKVKSELDNHGIQPPIPTSKIISKIISVCG